MEDHRDNGGSARDAELEDPGRKAHGCNARAVSVLRVGGDETSRPWIMNASRFGAARDRRERWVRDQLVRVRPR